MRVLGLGRLLHLVSAVVATALASSWDSQRTGRAKIWSNLEIESLITGISSSNKDQHSIHVTIVTTAYELIVAVSRGNPHIEIQAHIDLSMSASATCDSDTCTGAYDDEKWSEPHSIYFYLALGDIPSSVLSIRGNCNDPPPDELVKHITGTELLPLKPGQCLLTTDASLMNVEHGNMWLDGVYVRQKHTDSYYQSLISVGRKGTLWMTSVTLQGDGSHVPNCEQCALDVASQLYAEDCVFANFDGKQIVGVSGRLGADASFVGCEFLGNAIRTNHSNAVLAAWAGAEGAAAVRLEQTTFHDNEAEILLLAEDTVYHSDPVFFTDEDMVVWTVDDHGNYRVPSSSLSAAAENNATFLDPGPGSWLNLIQEDLFRLEQQDVDQSCKATWWDSAWALLTGEDPCTGKAAPGTEL